MQNKRSNQIPHSIEQARQVFKRAGGTLRARQARAAGVHPRTLAAMLHAGMVQRPSRGVYQLADTPTISDPDLVVAAIKAPGAVLCLISALALHELTTQIPHHVDLALPPGARAPRLDHPPVRFYRFGGRSMKEGIEQRSIGQTTVRIFSAAKTVADCFKFRNKVGSDVATEALRNYLRRRGSSVDELMRFADVNRIRAVMTPYIEATL